MSEKPVSSVTLIAKSASDAFVPHKTKAKDSASVWSKFLVSKDKLERAKCIKCGQILQTKGGSTKGLHTHLKCHDITLKRAPIESDCALDAIPPKQPKVTDFFESKSDCSLAGVVARMTAVDGFSFSAFLSSKDLRSLLVSRGFDVPKSRETIKKMVLDYYKKVLSGSIVEISLLKNKGDRFSLVFDEWTSTANKHFLNINVFSKEKFWNLGLMRYKCSMTAEVCVQMLKERLAEIKLDLGTDIVAITTDGASTMEKVGRLIQPYQQLCFAHGLQLAIVDVLYKTDPVQPVLLDCQVSDWGQWSECDKSCGTGMMSRTRKVQQPAQNGGKHCPSLVQKRGCQGFRCHGHHDKKILREMALLLPAALSRNRHANDSSDIRRNLRLRYRDNYKHNREHEYCVEFEVIKASKACHKLPPYNLMLEGDRITVRCDLEALIQDSATAVATANSKHKAAANYGGNKSPEITNNSAAQDDEVEDEEENVFDSEENMLDDYNVASSSAVTTTTSSTTTTTPTPAPAASYHCRGEGLSGRTTRWSALAAPSCRGKWLRLTVGAPKKCAHAQFIFV